MSWQTEHDAGVELIEKLKLISDAAKARVDDPGVVIPPEDFHNSAPRLHAQREWSRKSADYRQLTKEPLLAAVLTETEDGDRRVYYFARRAQVDGIDRYFTHSMSPVGRLATYEPGDDYTLPNGTDVTVLSKFILTPTLDHNSWDSRPTQSYWNEEDLKTLASLRDFITATGTAVDDWEALEEGSVPSTTPPRAALRGTGLRDQAILDKVQDEIFRLPLSSQMMISGPPGSGKTTTLIRRMAQKSEPLFLTDHEKVLVDRVSGPEKRHPESWVMFTPTELLEGYLSEAFNREGVPAPKDRVWTWAKYSIDFGREEARILRKSNNRSGFILDENGEHLDRNVRDMPWEWLKAFSNWLEAEHFSELKRASEKLKSLDDASLNPLSFQIFQSLAETSSASLFSTIEGLAPFGAELGQWRKSTLEKWRDLQNRRIDRFGRLDAQNIRRLNALVTEIEASKSSTSGEDDAQDEDDDFEIEERPTTQTRKDRVFAVVRQALNARARSAYGKRRIVPRYAELLEFIGEEVLSETQLSDLGRDLEALSGASRILRANNSYFSTMATRYRAFRRQAPEWYRHDEVSRDKIDRDELDGLLLTKLKAVHALFARADLKETFWSGLRPFAEKLRNQVYVDEATDFSEIQLAAMYHLTHPQIRSFIISGDFDQRLTEWGIKDINALQRAIPGIATREVEVGYRQSNKLKTFVDLMRRHWLGAEPNSVSPRIGQYEGFEPSMFEAEGNLEAQAQWVAERIQEIDQKHERLPSIAILVPRTEDVKPLAKRLEGLLESIPVSAHEEPGNLGRDEEIRVFPIHHVKGLEFEAAFFVGVDQLRRDVPTLFHRYLYVGSTRAATFLGFAANNRMPPEIGDLRDRFVSDWGN